MGFVDVGLILTFDWKWIYFQLQLRRHNMKILK